MNPRIAIVAALAVAALAGCSGGEPAPGGSPATSGLHEYAACLRANGYPEFPDPIPDDRGQWRMPDEAPNVDPAPSACEPIGRSFKEQVSADQERERATEMPQRRAFAACMRERGVPTFPDPDDEGNFTWPDGQEPDDNLVREPLAACRHLLPSLGEKGY